MGHFSVAMGGGCPRREYIHIESRLMRVLSVTLSTNDNHPNIPQYVCLPVCCCSNPSAWVRDIADAAYGHMKQEDDQSTLGQGRWEYGSYVTKEALCTRWCLRLVLVGVHCPPLLLVLN